MPPAASESHCCYYYMMKKDGQLVTPPQEDKPVDLPLYDEEALVKVNEKHHPHRQWQFHWSDDIQPILEIAYNEVAQKSDEERSKQSTESWLRHVLDRYMESRSKHGETFTLKHMSHDVTLSREATVPLPVVQEMINALCQSRFEPNMSKPPSELVSWLSSHGEFKFSHITDYSPIYRGPN